MYPQAFDGQAYTPTKTVFFSGATDTGCGQATSQVGPFYCPLDGLIYFDLDFLVQLQEQFGATGDLAAQYIVAHEYGHHIQNLLGTNETVRELQSRDPERANQYSVALELQADCYAGAWAYDANARDMFEEGEVAQRGDQRRRGGWRRSHPAAHPGSGRSGELDPRLGRAAGQLVPGRVRVRRSQRLRHVRRALSVRSPSGWR